MQVIELVNELIDEMDLADEAITEKATEHIHANEVILTFGLSQTTLKFLIRAAERRKFQVRPCRVASPACLPTRPLPLPDLVCAWLKVQV